jgi:hypothetical protein
MPEDGAAGAPARGIMPGRVMPGDIGACCIGMLLEDGGTEGV